MGAKLPRMPNTVLNHHSRSSDTNHYETAKLAKATSARAGDNKWTEENLWAEHPE